MNGKRFYEEMKIIEEKNMKYEKIRQKKIKKVLRWAKLKMFLLNIMKGD